MRRGAKAVENSGFADRNFARRLALKLPAGDLWWLGALVAGTVSSLALLAGLIPTLRAMRLNPVLLLRDG
ncbi:hypothetical protein [Marinobacter sp. HL-58]|uniref:hypothetical protein n=1 Tax=Marinobacter sp. HL-58 TaxID=1479237 RepID=UPI000483D436|nr:hypothetical protein [Marinobacter sp. HL-58]KPP97654.1 MAG: hypothetical protein HLUCCO03_10785 [Marinobacter sp. HL-58]